MIGTERHILWDAVPAQSDPKCLVFHFLQFSVTLDQGVGLSLINSVPEELVFGSVEGVHIQFSSSRHQQCINLTVQNLQVRIIVMIFTGC